MQDPNEALNLYMQRLEQQMMQQHIEKTDPRRQFKTLIQCMEDIVRLARNYIVVPHDPTVDGLVEKKVKTQLIGAYIPYAEDMVILYQKMFDIYKNIIEYCNNNVDKSVFNNQLHNAIIQKLEYMTSGIKDMTFEWSIENLEKLLGTHIDFAAEISTLFKSCPMSDDILKYMKEQCELVNHNFRNAIKALLHKFSEVTVIVAKEDSISAQQCAKWLREIVKEITNKTSVESAQKAINDSLRIFKDLFPSTKKPSAVTALPPPNSATEMKEFTKTKTPVYFAKDAAIAQSNREDIQKVLEQLDLSGLNLLLSSITKGKIENLSGILFDPSQEPGVLLQREDGKIEKVSYSLSDSTQPSVVTETRMTSNNLTQENNVQTICNNRT